MLTPPTSCTLVALCITCVTCCFDRGRTSATRGVFVRTCISLAKFFPDYEITALYSRLLAFAPCHFRSH